MEEILEIIIDNPKKQITFKLIDNTSMKFRYRKGEFSYRNYEDINKMDAELNFSDIKKLK